MRLKTLLAVIILLAVLMPAGAGAVVYGIKSMQAPGGATGSAPPTNFFSFAENGSGLTDHGPLKIDGNDINADALAYSPTVGLRAYDLRTDASYHVTGSRLIAIDPNTLAVTVLSDFEEGRNIRGAVWVNNNLWVLDANSSELLKVSPNTGAVLVAKTLTPAFSDCCDLAVSKDGTVYLVSFDYAATNTKIYTLDLATGNLSLVHTQSGDNCVYVGAAFSMDAPATSLFVFDAEWAVTNDDIFTQNTSDFNRTLLYPNIIPAFNAGRGDLASKMSIPNAAISLELLLDQ